MKATDVVDRSYRPASIANRYNDVQRAVVDEVFSRPTPAGVEFAQLNAVLAFTALGEGDARFVLDRIGAEWVVSVAGAVHGLRIHGRGNGPVMLTVANPAQLSRFGFQQGSAAAFRANGHNNALGSARAAVATRAFFSSDGIEIICTTALSAMKISAMLERIEIGSRRSGLAAVLIEADNAVAALRKMHLADTANIYERALTTDRLLQEQRRHAAASRVAAPEVFTDKNLARAKAAAHVEAERITALGDLTQYPVPEHLRLAAEFRRDNPHLNYPQCAGELGITKDTFTARIRRFWAAMDCAIHTQ
ncbi:Uncharacterized protein conserved in bacteria [Mycobacteroides abscessus subsp. massiliense]|nr:Uncharacterized protein conserved in bacteria [Mycobacteroides abscessus subsp. massiliense]